MKNKLIGQKVILTAKKHLQFAETDDEVYIRTSDYLHNPGNVLVRLDKGIYKHHSISVKWLEPIPEPPTKHRVEND